MDDLDLKVQRIDYDTHAARLHALWQDLYDEDHGRGALQEPFDSLIGEQIAFARNASLRPHTGVLAGTFARGVLAGCALFVMMPRLSGVAMGRGVFVVPQFRGRGAGTRMLALCRNELTKAGVERILAAPYHSNVDTQRWLTREGFNTIQYVMEMQIDKGS